MVKSYAATATKLTLPVVHAPVSQKPAVSHRSSNFDGKKHRCTRLHATQMQKLYQRHPNRIELVTEINGNCARQSSKIALLPANFWTANSEGTQRVAHLTVINGSRLALEICWPGKVLQRKTKMRRRAQFVNSRCSRHKTWWRHARTNHRVSGLVQRDVNGKSGGYILALRDKLGMNFTCEWLWALLAAVLPEIYTGIKIPTNPAL